MNGGFKNFDRHQVVFGCLGFVGPFFFWSPKQTGPPDHVSLTFQLSSWENVFRGGKVGGGLVICGFGYFNDVWKQNSVESMGSKVYLGVEPKIGGWKTPKMDDENISWKTL